MDDNKDIRSLIQLLDDEDREIFRIVRAKLIDAGPVAVPELEAAWEESFNPMLQQRIEDIVHQIQFSDTIRSLKEWKSSPGKDLLKGWLILSRYQYPDLEEKRLLDQIERIKKDAWIEINEEQTAAEKVKVLNQIIYGIHGFAANTSNYHAPGNNYLNNLLESKRGNAVSLSALYVLLAQGLKIPVYGVNLPGHFIMAYKDESPESMLFKLNEQERILFYLNPLNKGAIFSRREIEVYLKRAGLEYEENYFVPCSNEALLAVILENLISAFREDRRAEKIYELEELLGIIND